MLPRKLPYSQNEAGKVIPVYFPAGFYSLS